MPSLLQQPDSNHHARDQRSLDLEDPGSRLGRRQDDHDDHGTPTSRPLATPHLRRPGRGTPEAQSGRPCSLEHLSTLAVGDRAHVHDGSSRHMLVGQLMLISSAPTAAVSGRHRHGRRPGARRSRVGGRTGLAGEIGYISVDPHGPDHVEGLAGSLEGVRVGIRSGRPMGCRRARPPSTCSAPPRPATLAPSPSATVCTSVLRAQSGCSRSPSDADTIVVGGGLTGLGRRPARRHGEALRRLVGDIAAHRLTASWVGSPTCWTTSGPRTRSARRSWEDSHG